MASTVSPAYLTTVFPFVQNNSDAQPKDTVEQWESAEHEQERREQQRRRIANWRKQKKKRMSALSDTRQQLEKTLQLRVDAARVATDRGESGAARSDRETIGCGDADTVKTEIMSRPHLSNGIDQRFVEECDDILKNNDVWYTNNHPFTATVGKIFGWSVDYTPPQNSAGTFMAHARFIKRLRCSLDDAYRIIPSKDKSLRPSLITACNWGHVQIGGISCQILQAFSDAYHVLAYNIPGEVSLPYLAIAQNSRGVSPDGKRANKYEITLADSEANALN
ncbi:hypothetical protein F442_09052 [Phytophthora nicotianae P10297]|uniref:Uncharacterized protein n=1 Tax=Phytophthora nicotianae P10297 TaxID=1317064 RepID=W2ZAP6_PHYNI|nr:hypothetical protein F442_09052 [Phytophthora nicotianae P10297]